MLGILTFILVFGIIVVVHEFGHFYFAKKSGILVREFAIGMGPKIFAHIGKDGTALPFESCLWVAMFAWPVGVMIQLKSRQELLSV